MKDDILDAIQYIYRDNRVPSKWEKDFGELNWLGPCCSRVKIGYGGEIYTCIVANYDFSPSTFKVPESSIHIENYIDNNRIGGLLIKSFSEWESIKGYLIKHAISVILEEFLKEHKECYYK